MKIGRASTAGESRSCPHCRATILKSAMSCPICRHMLRASSVVFEPRSKPTTCPLLVEGTLEYPGAGDPLEYQVLMEVRDAGETCLVKLSVSALSTRRKSAFSLYASR
jgi:hypothetical protein